MYHFSPKLLWHSVSRMPLLHEITRCVVYFSGGAVSRLVMCTWEVAGIADLSYNNSIKIVDNVNYPGASDGVLLGATLLSAIRH